MFLYGVRDERFRAEMMLKGVSAHDHVPKNLKFGAKKALCHHVCRLQIRLHIHWVDFTVLYCFLHICPLYTKVLRALVGVP